MTYEEAKALKLQWQKDGIKARLYKLNPDKYKQFKPYAKKIKGNISTQLALAWEVEIILMQPKIKNLFERDDVFFNAIKKKTNPAS